MTSIKKTLDTIFAKISVRHKWQLIFLLELFEVIFSIQGRVNFSNLARYSKYNECTFRRNFKKFFDWVGINLQIMELAGFRFSNSNPVIAAIDCSFISKAGKKTWGLDHFFSGAANRTLRGLEISLLSLIDVCSKKAWALDVVQTPPQLLAREGEASQYSRINFYIEQILDLLPQLKQVTYFVADGFYAKIKFFLAILGVKKHLITKLRSDANLRYFFKGKPPKNKRGRKKQYDGKVNWKKLDLRKWVSIGLDYKYPHIKIYALVLNSPYFKLNLKVVLLINTRNNRYALLACTDLNLCARTIVEYYQLRFQIEFLFRDAKQFTGLTHCQARDEQALDFHFNMSLTAINIAQLHMMNDHTNKSMNSLVRKAYNTRFANWLFSKLGPEAKLYLNDPQLNTVLGYGCLNRT